MTTAMLGRGEMLGGYRIDDLVGVGGMAIVYRAEQVSLRRTVALKVLAPQLSRDAAFRERFRREGRHVAALTHPNVVAIFDSGEADDRLYLAMRLVEGTTLAHRIAEHGVSPDDAVTILTPIASALDAAHALGLVHRDIKPQNILLDADGTPFLADFGVATRLGPGAAATSTGGFVGSVHYAAPEQIRGAPATARSDIYSLAAVLFQCLTGEVPYPLEGDAAVMHAHLHDPPPRLRATVQGSQAVARVIAHAMAKEPSERPGAAGAMLDELARAIATLPPQVRAAAPGFAALAAPTGARERDRPRARARGGRSRRRARLLALPAAGALVALVLALALAGGTRRAPPLPADTLASGPLRLHYGAGWRPSAAPSIDARAIASPIGLRSGGARLAAGPVIGGAPLAGGAPPRLLRTLGAPATRGVVAIAAGTASRYTWPLPAGRLLVATVLATTRGDVALICDTGVAVRLERACLATAAGARLAGARARPPAPLERGTPAGALADLDSYWSDIAVGDYAGAYQRLAPGAVGPAVADFVASERATGIREVRFEGAVRSASSSGAVIDVRTLLTRDTQHGCRRWSGSYAMEDDGGRWLIRRADIVPRGC